MGHALQHHYRHRGQKLERWQKLVLQTLTDRPVATLSAASSRALAAQHSTAHAGHATAQSEGLTAAAAGAAAGGDAEKQLQGVVAREACSSSSSRAGSIRACCKLATNSGSSKAAVPLLLP
jgi:hypothetical protein